MSDSGNEGKAKPQVLKAKKPAGGIAATDVRKKRQVALGSVLAPLMEPALAKQGILLAQIAPHWRAICPLLAAHSCPESVKGDTLTVAVASDGVKQELHYVTPQILDGIARLLGYSAIAKVRAVTRHDLMSRRAMQGIGGVNSAQMKPAQATSGAARDKAETMCKSVRDDELRAALSRLGATIVNNDKKG